MHQLLVCFLLICTFLAPIELSAGNPNVVTAQYTVIGNCGQCKARIEDAAYIKGVKFAEWDKHTQLLTIKYDSTKTGPNLFLQSIARAGHDAGDFKATNEDYNKLPNCCKYRSGNKTH